MRRASENLRRCAVGRRLNVPSRCFKRMSSRAIRAMRSFCGVWRPQPLLNGPSSVLSRMIRYAPRTHFKPRGKIEPCGHVSFITCIASVSFVLFTNYTVIGYLSMVRLSLILVPMPGAHYYAKKGYKKPVTVYIRVSTYEWLLFQAQQNEWSLQTVVRRYLEDAESKGLPPPMNRQNQ